MKNKILIIIAFLLINNDKVNGQYCSNDNRYTEATYFNLNQINVNTNVQYGIAEDYKGNQTALIMDLYYPNLNIDVSPKRPFILLAHGGGFSSGDKQEGDIRDLCYHLAMRGFVCASINYRLGHDFSEYGQYKARYRAIQDGHAALRFVVNNANLIRIDTNWIFVGGQSAGAILAQGLVYTDQSEVDSLTTVINSTNISDELGTLKSSGNTLTNTYSIKGVFNNWGAIPEYEIDYNEMLPTISFHGVLDSTVSIDYKDQQYFIMNGSRTIHNKLIENNVCSELTIDPIGGHGIYRNEQSLFRAQRASCFFKSIFCNSCTNLYTTDSIPSNCSTSLSVNGDNFSTTAIVYPNPFEISFNIDGIEGNLEIKIFNSFGQLVYQTETTNGLNQVDLMPGIYFLNVRNLDSKETYISKLIKL